MERDFDSSGSDTVDNTEIANDLPQTVFLHCIASCFILVHFHHNSLFSSVFSLTKLGIHLLQRKRL